MFNAVEFCGSRRSLLSVAALVAIVAAGCGGAQGNSGGNSSGGNNKGGNNNGGNNNGGNNAASNVALASKAGLGNYLVSAEGRTLYYFALDVPAAAGQAAVSNCTGGCLPIWPIFHVDGLSAGSGLNAADFAEFTRPAGAKQTTFKGLPLYFFAGDTKAGDTTGDNLGDPRPTDLWFVIKDPFYAALVFTKDGGPERYLADPAGRALYTFANGTVGTGSSDPVSACTVDPCKTNWPVFAAGDGSLPTSVDPAKLTSFTRPDGVKQSAFDGHPLYYFHGDTAPGDTKGRGVNGVFATVDPSTL